MKKLMIIATAAAAAAGCQTAHVKVDGDGKWEATVRSHWFSREIADLSGEVMEGGKFKFALNGYKGDVSEQLPAFTREMWQGLAFLGQIAAATVNPAAASVAAPASTGGPQFTAAKAQSSQSAAPSADKDCDGGVCAPQN